VFAVLAAWVASSGEPADATVRWVDAALERAAGPVEPSALPLLVLSLILIEDFERAIGVTTDSIDAGTADGDIPSISASLTWRACAHYRCGNIPAAESDARMAVETARKFPRGIYTLFSAAALVEVLVERGEIGGAASVLEEAGDPGDAEGMLFNLFLIHARGRLLSARGEHQSAVVCLRDVAERTKQAGWLSPALACWRSDLALALAGLGEREEASALAQEEVELARAFGRPRALGVALRAHGLVEGGALGVSLLADAVSVLERSAARLEYARALVDLGGTLRRVNQRVLSRERLSDGARVAARCGASTLVERAHQELLVAGARPRRFGPELRDQLTASERRVADLAASGMTNREIAQALFVTMRTVETHLTHVYSKLDINGREPLAAALAASVR